MPAEMPPSPVASITAARRLALVEAHLDAETRHDVGAIMATFGPDARFHLNATVLERRQDIRQMYEMFGFAPGGAFAGLGFETRQRFVADDAIVLEGLLRGRHVGDFQGLAPTQRDFALPLCAIFTFDLHGTLAAERVYFDAADLLRQLTA